MWNAIMSTDCDDCQYSSRRNNDSDDLQFNNDDIPFYEVPNDENAGTSRATSSSPGCLARRSLDDLDASSHDSGYAAIDNRNFLSYASPSRGLSSSFGSGSGSLSFMDDALMEEFSDIEPLDKPTLPKDFGKLINDPLPPRTKQETSSPQDAFIRPLFRRALSLQNGDSSNNNIRANLFKIPEGSSKGSCKRATDDEDVENANCSKRSKQSIEATTDETTFLKPSFKMQFSASEESIMCAVQRSSTDPDLIGDFSKNYCLPLVNGRHQDLKAISANTLAKLMKGEFASAVESFKVIDCRYPYEFVGGHIDGAINIYTKDQVADLLNIPSIKSNKRQILVFHCEFSSERGPNLYRHLRKEDRTMNMRDYPALRYPEIYLLEGGYKSFFQEFSEMCVPVAYTKMTHPDHEADLRHFRQKSKTWNVDTRQKSKRTVKRL